MSSNRSPRLCSLRLFGITGCSAMLSSDVRTKWAPGPCHKEVVPVRRVMSLAEFCLPVLALRIGTISAVGAG